MKPLEPKIHDANSRVIGFITAPRQNYDFNSTLLEFPNETCIVCEEPSVPLYARHLTSKIKSNKTVLGCVLNWISCLEELQNYDKQIYVICEDDIELRVNLDQIIDESLIYLNYKSPLLISPYCSLKCQPKEKGWFIYDNRLSWCGSLMFIMNNKTLKYLTHNKNKIIEYSTFNNKCIHLDTALGKLIPIMAHNPTYVLHTSKYSTWSTQSNFSVARRPAL